MSKASSNASTCKGESQSDDNGDKSDENVKKMSLDDKVYFDRQFKDYYQPLKII